MSAPYPYQRPPGISLADLDSVPLFMRRLPEDDGSNNIALEALQSLVYEGTPNEQAMTFKEQGNEYYKKDRYREALAYYTQGVMANPPDPIIQEALLLNRAACNLALKNFGMVLRDTSAALMINPRAHKAYYRAAGALLGLERYIEALDACDRCLAFDPQNHQILTQKAKVISQKEAHDRREMEKQERLRKEREEKRVMNAAFQSLNLVIVPQPPSVNSQYQPHFDPSFSGLRTIATPILFPVFLVYPLHNDERDVVVSFDPSSTFASHFKEMFPPTPGTPAAMSATGPPVTGPDWDKVGDYTISNLSIYATTHRRRILKIGKRMTLRDACDAAAATSPPGVKDGLELINGALNFYVLPKGDRELLWVNTYKARRAAEGIQA